MVVGEAERSEAEFLGKIYITIKALVFHGRIRKEITGNRRYAQTLRRTHDRTIPRERRHSCKDGRDK